MKYKSIYVSAELGTYEDTSFFGGTQQKQSTQWIDGPAFALKCQSACNSLDAEGYEVISINEIVRGKNAQFGNDAAAGWSVTQGVVISGKRKPDSQPV